MLYSTVLTEPKVKLSVPAKPMAPPLEPFVLATNKPLAFETNIVPLMVAEPKLAIVIKLPEDALVENFDPASTVKEV